MGDVCRNNRACIKYLAQAIENGSLPLTSENRLQAWNLFNPYRMLDILNL